MRPSHALSLAAALLPVVLLAFHAGPSLAGNPADADRRVTNTEGFLGLHPDLRWRRDGLAELQDGRPDAAFVAFRNAARFADKPSQSMVAEMYWQGRGTPVDKALGYVWMDLAAERGYSLFVAKREHYWQNLDDSERARALALGPELYDEYGDDVARPRLARRLRQGLLETTGSRVGTVSAFLEIRQQTPSGGVTSLTGREYYDRKYWQPELYFAWQDATWNLPVDGEGAVDVGPVAVPADGEPAPRRDD
jgi:hypothetical protein